jgi:hypothetical protein
VFITRGIILVSEIVSRRIQELVSLQESNKLPYVLYTRVKFYVLYRYNVCTKNTRTNGVTYTFCSTSYLRAVQLVGLGKTEDFRWT